MRLSLQRVATAPGGGSCRVRRATGCQSASPPVGSRHTLPRQRGGSIASIADVGPSASAPDASRDAAAAARTPPSAHTPCPLSSPHFQAASSANVPAEDTSGRTRAFRSPGRSWLRWLAVAVGLAGLLVFAFLTGAWQGRATKLSGAGAAVQPSPVLSVAATPSGPPPNGPQPEGLLARAAKVHGQQVGDGMRQAATTLGQSIENGATAGATRLAFGMVTSMVAAAVIVCVTWLTVSNRRNDGSGNNRHLPSAPGPATSAAPPVPNHTSAPSPSASPSGATAAPGGAGLS
ncbi:hypothetical protein HYH03_012646 [Edaphochlamys debaryana]|uniref:Uncharacterized protein n=1 Tax=Edaphochlamys debaryana TaxID=47281 RepID=A0A835XSF8_9CHLO|nr:hypothetical protein HYH03_012646 [Edaphochlamys debaryana]|eukprot:KAG2488850.1 hypothetical protein HYH03_012646 [Edaphochlamys debaryana]